MLTNSVSFCIDGLLLRYENGREEFGEDFNLQISQFADSRSVIRLQEDSSSPGVVILKNIKYKHKMNKKIILIK